MTCRCGDGPRRAWTCSPTSSAVRFDQPFNKARRTRSRSPARPSGEVAVEATPAAAAAIRRAASLGFSACIFSNALASAFNLRRSADANASAARRSVLSNRSRECGEARTIRNARSSLASSAVDDSLHRRFRLGDGGLHAIRHLGGDAFGHGAKNGFLVGEIGIGGRFGDRCLRGNRLHGGSPEPGNAEDALRGVQNPGAARFAPGDVS